MTDVDFSSGSSRGLFGEEGVVEKELVLGCKGQQQHQQFQIVPALQAPGIPAAPGFPSEPAVPDLQQHQLFEFKVVVGEEGDRDQELVLGD